MKHHNVGDIRKEFIRLKENNILSENGTYEIINASFIADEPTIFGELNPIYIDKELDWYLSKNLNINGIKEPVPKIWKNICDENGKINSNYGWCILSEENHNQFDKAINKLELDKHSRQSVMIYIRPTMHEDSISNGMKDFMCTYGVQLFIRDDKLHYIVYMRSNDVIFGYKNDKYWHSYIHLRSLVYLRNIYPELILGDLYWNAASLHIYPNHFNLI